MRIPQIVRESIGKPMVVSSALRRAFDGVLEEESGVKLVTYLEHLLEKLAKARTHISSAKPGASRARLVYKMLDSEHVRINKKTHNRDGSAYLPIQCTKGCSHCCHIFVTCTDDEADLLLEVAKEKGIEIDKRRLALQKDLDDDGYLQLSKIDSACVFLGSDKTCMVYEDRPAACRNFLVVSPADYCDTEKYPNGRIAGEFRAQPEIIASAAMQLDSDASTGKVSSLASKIWKRLDR